jgi:hypothetical protein
LPVPTKINIAKNICYLLASAKGDIIAESWINGEVRNIKIPDVFLVKDLHNNNINNKNTYNNSCCGMIELLFYNIMFTPAIRNRYTLAAEQCDSEKTLRSEHRDVLGSSFDNVTSYHD